MNHFIPEENYLKGKVILVTGASSGIGKTMATCFAQFGAEVILLSRNAKKLTEVAQNIIQAGYPAPLVYPFNLAEATETGFATLKKSIEEKYGKLDGLLHNAALLGKLTPIEQIDVTDWYKVMQVNFHSVFLLTQTLLSLLKRAEAASIVFTTASEGLESKAYWGAYGLSKYAIQGLMSMLAQECENHSNIRVNSINPGKVHTALRNQAYPAEDKSNLLLPEDLINMYLYVIGNASLGITGKTFSVEKRMEVVSDT